MNIESDKNRDEELINRGIITLRIKNEELADIKAVLLKIRIFLEGD
jgi:very-short-patch-repair endonuclease